MPTAAPPDISIVIVSWNGRHYLDECLNGVAAQDAPPFETLVVDNASTDGTSDYVRERYPWVRVITLAGNRGYAGGNNAGAREARGRYLVFLNNDTAPAPGWLRALRGAVDEAAGFCLTTSKVVYMHDPTTIDTAGDGYLRAGGAFKRLHGAPAEAASESTEVFGVSGAACLISRAVFEELGGFDEDFFASHEDVDLSYRARLRGYRCRYVADAVVRHHGSATLGRTSPFAVFHGQRNLEWVYFKNTPTLLLIRTLPAHFVYDAAAAVYFARQGLLAAFLRAKIAALGGMTSVIGKRAIVQRTRRVSTNAIQARLEPGWLSLKRREKRFDTGLAEGTR